MAIYFGLSGHAHNISPSSYKITWMWFFTFQLFVGLFCLYKYELSSLFNGRELYSNNITGKIPEELGNLTNLVSLDLYLNHLSGTIPTTLGNLEKLRFLYDILSLFSYLWSVKFIYVGLIFFSSFTLFNILFLFFFASWCNMRYILELLKHDHSISSKAVIYKNACLKKYSPFIYIHTYGLRRRWRLVEASSYFGFNWFIEKLDLAYPYLICFLLSNNLKCDNPTPYHCHFK